MAEALAIRLAVQRVNHPGFHPLSIETNSVIVGSSSCVYVNKESNLLTHHLARLALDLTHNTLLMDSVPSKISHIVADDYTHIEDRFMANRVSFSKLLLQSLLRRPNHRHHQFTRPLSSTPSSTLAVSPLSFDEKSEPQITTCDLSILDFNDVQRLFSSVPTLKLLRSAVNLHMAAFDPMVDVGIWVMRSKLMETPVVKDAILTGINHTFTSSLLQGRIWKKQVGLSGSCGMRG
ncbi:hypothetical protein Ancab_034329 [Ancistrocladus abbreviatus]